MAPEFEFSDLELEPLDTNNQQLNLIINNNAATATANQDMFVQITSMDGSQAYYQTTISQLSMAPYSQLMIPLQLDKETLQSGDYKVDMTITIGELRQTLTKNFNYESTLVEKRAGFTDFSDYFIYIGLTLLAILFLFGSYFIGRKVHHGEKK
ncbi:WxL protein host-binding domain-containing protein [Enterococcus sp. LJL90]